jgi:hypothetical protein
MTLATEADAPPVQPRTIRADVERDVARTQATVDQVVAMLSLQPPGSPCHNVTALYSGLYVPVHLFPNHRINVYAHPWSRGWSIFADEAPRPAFGVPLDTVVLPGAHSWRTYPSSTWACSARCTARATRLAPGTYLQSRSWKPSSTSQTTSLAWTASDEHASARNTGTSPTRSKERRTNKTMTDPDRPRCECDAVASANPPFPYLSLHH